MVSIRLNLYQNKNRIIAIGILAFIVGGVFGSALWHLGGVYVEFPFPGWEGSSLERFSSYDELKNFLKTSQNIPPYYRNLITSWAATLEAGDSGKGGTDYSTTNIQVEGVDELDVVKTDGEFLYIVSGKKVYIIDAYPAEEAEILSVIELEEMVEGMFVNDDVLVLFLGGYDPYGVFRWEPYYHELEYTTIKIYDISDRSSPKLEDCIGTDGYYFNSRMIENYLYVVINKPAFLNNSEVDLPTVEVNNESIEIVSEEIFYNNISDYYYYFTNIISINLDNLVEEPIHETYLLGATSEIYVSQKNMYITSPVASGVTNIYKINIEDGEIKYIADGSVKGFVLNQFSMDEYEDHFRISTTSNGGSLSKNNIYILNSSLGLVGQLEGLAPGEEIHSARFMVDKCYLVTFKKVDPLFVIDLKDHENPEVLGKLKIPGYSDYLHPYDDEHLIGVGKETIPAEEPDFAWYQGVKISLFDVSNLSNPIERDKVEIGDRGTDTPVLRDHKAFLFSKSKNLLVLPILVAEIDESDYPEGVPPYVQGEYVYQGAYVFELNSLGLSLKGRITHLTNSTDLIKSGYYFTSAYEVKRALYIENILYTISDKIVMMNNLEDLEEINVIELS